jgi:hypothetical protein
MHPGGWALTVKGHYFLASAGRWVSCEVTRPAHDNFRPAHVDLRRKIIHNDGHPPDTMELSSQFLYPYEVDDAISRHTSHIPRDPRRAWMQCDESPGWDAPLDDQ